MEYLNQYIDIDDAAIACVSKVNNKPANEPWNDADEKQLSIFISGANWQKNQPTDKYKHFNHHHELTEDHRLVDFGDGEFIANKPAIPLLKALYEAGLRTRSHHIGNDGFSWVCILLDGVELEIRKVNEGAATRTKYNGKTELLIRWNK